MTGALDASALIVGIDGYLSIKQLRGCVEDAVDFANWLIGIGVPRERIRLNIAPRSDLPTIQPPEGVILGGASRKEIWESITGIKSEAGEWLFVLWSGHGYYLVEPRSPIFLTQEFDLENDTAKNLAVFEFADYFQSLDFKNQWLIVDACQNYPQDVIYPISRPKGPMYVDGRRSNPMPSYYVVQLVKKKSHRLLTDVVYSPGKSSN